jgi:hypothetical protein
MIAAALACYTSGRTAMDDPQFLIIFVRGCYSGSRRMAIIMAVIVQAYTHYLHMHIRSSCNVYASIVIHYQSI